MSRYRSLQNLALAAAFAVPALFFSYKAYTVGLLDGFFGRHAPVAEGGPASAADGATACSDCHEDVDNLHARGPHSSLLCEDCHGPQEVHRRDGTTPPVNVATSSIVRLCSQCHRDIRKSRTDGPRINLEAHVVEVGALFSDRVCFDCHRPHDPRP